MIAASMRRRANGNGAARGDLMVELVEEVRKMRRDMNAGFRGLSKREDRRWDDHERRLRQVEQKLGLR